MTFVTVFAGGIAIQNVGWKIWFWQLFSCVVALVFVYYMCPEVSILIQAFYPLFRWHILKLLGGTDYREDVGGDRPCVHEDR